MRALITDSGVSLIVFFGEIIPGGVNGCYKGKDSTQLESAALKKKKIKKLTTTQKHTQKRKKKQINTNNKNNAF